MEIKAVVIDDEENNVDNLRLLLKRNCEEVKVIGSAGNAEDGYTTIVKQRPELVFLDIEMPVKNGFDLLQALPEHNFEIIFVTAHEKYGIQAIKFAAIDYLLKPINTDELKSAVAKAILKRMREKRNRELENLMLLLQQQSKSEHRIALPALKETRFVKTEEIIRCQSSNNYTTFYFTSGEKLVVSKPIYEYEEMLAAYQFIRCHQSHLVNKRYVKSWVKDNGDYLLMDDKTMVPLSKQKRDLVKQLLLQ